MNSHKLGALLDCCKAHLNQKRCRTILVALACVVVFGTTYALILPAVTMTLVCDQEEHTHTDECYEEVLVCDNEDPDHEHDASCYEKELVCTIPEHEHDESCYARPGTEDEDTDGDADADTNDADGDSADENSDAEETPDEPEEPDWDANLPRRLTGNWAEDMVAVAESQLANDEPEHYAAWYTEHYNADADDQDATAPFAAFCLYYAEVNTDEDDALPPEATAEDWADALDEDLLPVDEDNTPQPGDLVFYRNEDETLCVAVVTGESEDGIFPAISNADGTIDEIAVEEEAAAGYVRLPENPDPDGDREEPDDSDKSDKDDSKDQDTTEDGQNNNNSDSNSHGSSDFDNSADGKGDQDKNDEDPADEDQNDQTPDAPAEEDTLPAVPKGALSARLSDGSMQVTVQTTPCQNPEHEHDSDEAYYADEPAYGRITVAATNAEPPEHDTAVLRVYLNFSNEHGSAATDGDSVQSTNNHKYTYTLSKLADDTNTYYFDLPRPHPGDQVEIPFTVQYETSLAHGGTATLWCAALNNPDIAPQTKANDTKTLTWAVYEAKQDMLAEGTYGNYTFSHNDTKNAFTEKEEYSKYIVKNSPLGLAGSFHIVAFDTAYIQAHCNGNILAKNAYLKAAHGTNNLTDELSYIVNVKENAVSDQASSNDHILVVGSETTVTVEGNQQDEIHIGGSKIGKPYNIVQDKDSANKPFIDLDDVKNEISTISEILANQPQNGIQVDFTRDMNDQSLILPDPDGAYYYNTTIDDLRNTIQDRELRLKGFQSEHTGSIVVNIDCAGHSGGTVYVPKVILYVDGNRHNLQEVTSFEYGIVIFNFVNAEGVTIVPNLMDGAIIAPGATVRIEQNINGTIVAENVTIAGGESHRTDFTGTVIPANLKLQFQKKVDGEDPSIYQMFTFNLEEWNSSTSSWGKKEEQNNHQGYINFSMITYTKNDTGTHWYRISEQADNDSGYRYDSTKYFVKVDVAQNGDKMEDTYTYYSSTSSYDDGPDESTLTEVQGGQQNCVFHNTTDDGAHTLPSTGGPGEWTIPSIGLLLMAGSLLVVTKQRPQRKEDR